MLQYFPEHRKTAGKSTWASVKKSPNRLPVPPRSTRPGAGVKLRPPKKTERHALET